MSVRFSTHSVFRILIKVIKAIIKQSTRGSTAHLHNRLVCRHKTAST